MPSSAVYRHRFGSLIRAYELIGYTTERDYAFIEINRRLRRIHPGIVDNVMRSIIEVGGRVVQDPQTDMLLINEMLAVSFVLARCYESDAGTPRWLIRLDEGLGPDLTIAARLDASNNAVLDYYLLPSLDIRIGTLRIKEDNGIYLDGYRFDTLDYFFGMVQLVPVGVAA
jgi:hypothetical protein